MFYQQDLIFSNHQQPHTHGHRLDEEQKEAAEKIIQELNAEKVYDDPIVTEVTPIDVFYLAEDYHKNYYNNNKNQGYCRAVINPKLDKFMKKYGAKTK